MTLKEKLQKIQQDNASAKVQNTKDTSTVTWLEQATAKGNRYASAKVYSK